LITIILPRTWADFKSWAIRKRVDHLDAESQALISVNTAKPQTLQIAGAIA
jgi:hypothetical protein